MRRVAGAAILVLSMSCFTERRRGSEHALEGAWTLTLTMTEPPVAPSGPISDTVVQGRVRLVPTPSGDYEGQFDLDLTPLGLELRSEGVPSRVLGRKFADSVQVVLNSNISDGQLVLNGEQRGQIIQGSWHFASLRGSRGTFRMTEPKP